MHAVSAGPFDLVLCNPPYVPAATDQDTERIPPSVGPATAWDAGDDGRELLDALCERSSDLLCDGGTMLVVQSEFAGIDETACALRCAGLNAGVIASRLIPFGPVMSARAAWLEETGRLAPGRREERIAVIRADKR
jgi:release factor glutamine methyltransferase